jgi:hypothetical protein
MVERYFDVISHWFRAGFNLQNLSFYFIYGGILTFVLFLVCFFLSHKTRPNTTYSIVLNKLYGLVFLGFLLHVFNVLVFLFYCFFDSTQYLSAGISIVFTYSVFSLYLFNKIGSNNYFKYLSGVEFSRNSSSIKRIVFLGKLRKVYAIWFLQLLPYLLIFYKIYNTPNYSIVFDNSASMTESIDEAKRFVRREFSNIYRDNNDFIITKIPPLDENTQRILSDFNIRLSRENAQAGQMQISLKWDNLNDLDLHLIEPDGNKIYYRNKTSRGGGILDIDMNAGVYKSNEPVENIYFPRNIPKGKYQIVVDFYNKHTNIQNNKFSVLLALNGSNYIFTGFSNVERIGKKIVEFNYDEDKIVNIKDFTVGQSIAVTGLNPVMSISDIIKVNSNDLRAISYRVSNTKAFIDSIESMSCDGFGSPISQLIKQNYQTSLNEFGAQSGDNRLVVITDGEDESLVNGIFDGEKFILEYDELNDRVGGINAKPIEFFSKIDFIVCEGETSGLIPTPLHELASVNKNVRIHRIDSTSQKINIAFGKIFKDAVINWEYFFTSIMLIFLVGVIINYKIWKL